MIDGNFSFRHPYSLLWDNHRTGAARPLNVEVENK